jgi:hypothetical protein
MTINSFGYSGQKQNIKENTIFPGKTAEVSYERVFKKHSIFIISWSLREVKGERGNCRLRIVDCGFEELKPILSPTEQRVGY